MTSYLISVVIPNYNHSKFLNARLNSVLEQTYRNFEVIILDDFSNDQSRVIIEQYRNHPKITHIVFNKQNSGSTFSQWNRGVALAKGEIIWIAESDDVADKKFLETLLPNFIDTKIGLTYCQSLSIDRCGNITGSWEKYTDGLDEKIFKNKFSLSGLDYINRFLIYKNTIPNCSAVLFRKTIFTEIEGADVSIKYCSDWLTWLKMLSISNIAFIPQTLSSFRNHEESVIATAVNRLPKTIFLPNFERKMREEFKNFLKVRHNTLGNIDTLKRKNQLLILELYGDEGLFEIRNKKWIAGWEKVIIVSLRRGGKIKLLLRAAKLSIKTALILN